MDVAKLNRKLNRLNRLFWIGFYSKHWIDFINNKKKVTFDDAFKPEAAPIIEKYRAYKSPEGTIGNRVWVFWYTGIDSAPAIVRKCIEEMKKMEDIDLVFLDKSNLDEYFIWDKSIKDKFDKGSISITFLADVIRNQLMARFGGFWFDSTLLFFDKAFIKEHKEHSYYSLKHSDYAACSHFNDGKWSSFLSGTSKGHKLPSFTDDIFNWYFNLYDTLPDYFLIDYVYNIAYEEFEDIRKEIDGLKAENEDAFYIGRNIKKECSDKKWNDLLTKNKVQKLIWKIPNTDKLINKTKGLYYRVLHYGK